jgi:hypothetical protein
MKTQIRHTTHAAHTTTNLYTYIQNAQQVENLELQIKQKEKDLEALEQLHGIYKNMGCMNMLEVSQERANSIGLEILLLKLEKNKLEEKLLKFELMTFLEN